MIASALISTSASATELPRLAEELFLLRLLMPAKQSPGLSRIRADLQAALQVEMPQEAFSAGQARLAAEGFITQKPLGLTTQGRERALEFLGIKELPAGMNWRRLKARYLVPRALGLDPHSPTTRSKTDRSEKLAAFLLRRHFGLPLGPEPSLGETLEALACRELGFPELTRLSEVKEAVLSRWLGADRPLTTRQLQEQIPRVKLGAKRGLNGLHQRVLQQWFENARSRESLANEAFDLPAFANTVLTIARDCPTGRFGDNKVFINHIWRRSRDERAFQGMDLRAFKERLVEASMAKLLTLSRADLVSVMDPTDVQESEARHLNAEFHFVLLS